MNKFENYYVPKELTESIKSLEENDKLLLNSSMLLVMIHNNISILGSYQIDLIMKIIIDGFIKNCIEIQTEENVYPSFEIYNAFIEWLESITINKKIIDFILFNKFIKLFPQNLGKITEDNISGYFKLKTYKIESSFNEFYAPPSAYLTRVTEKHIFGRHHASLLDLSHNERFYGRYFQHEHFDYHSVVLQLFNDETNIKHYDLTNQLSKKYHYVTEIIITVDNFDSIDNVKLNYGNGVKLIFTKNQLKLYDVFYKQIIFKNETTNKYIIKLPYWFSKTSQLALNLMENIKYTLDIYSNDNIIVEAYVVEIKDDPRNEFEKFKNRGSEYLVDFFYERNYKLKVSNKNYIHTVDFHLPIKEIAWFYTKNKKEYVPIADSVELLINEKIIRKYTMDQLTGSEQIVHHGKQIPGLYYISFAYLPQLIQPTGHISIPNSSRFTLKHNFSNIVRESDEIQINFIIFGYNVIRYISGFTEFAYSITGDFLS
jgi:hypothetical protein